MGDNCGGVCPEHSGVAKTMEIQWALLKKFDAYADAQTKRTYSLFVGIILCLVTGLVTLAVASYRPPIDYKALDKIIAERFAPGFAQNSSFYGGGEYGN